LTGRAVRELIGAGLATFAEYVDRAVFGELFDVLQPAVLVVAVAYQGCCLFLTACVEVLTFIDAIGVSSLPFYVCQKLIDINLKISSDASALVYSSGSSTHH